MQAQQLAGTRQAAGEAAAAARKLVKSCVDVVELARGAMEETRELWAVQQDRLRVCMK